MASPSDIKIGRIMFRLKFVRIPPILCDFLICFWYWLETSMFFHSLYSRLNNTNNTKLIELGVEAEVFLSWLKDEMPNVSRVRLPATLSFVGLHVLHEDVIYEFSKERSLNEITQIHAHIHERIGTYTPLLPTSWELPWDYYYHRTLTLTFSEGSSRPSTTRIGSFFTSICGPDGVEKVDIRKSKDGSNAYGYVVFRRFLHVALIMKENDQVDIDMGDFEMSCEHRVF